MTTDLRVPDEPKELTCGWGVREDMRILMIEYTNSLRSIATAAVALVGEMERHAANSLESWLLAEKELQQRASAAEAEREGLLTWQREVMVAAINLFKFLRPHLTDECKLKVDEMEKALSAHGQERADKMDRG